MEEQSRRSPSCERRSFATSNGNNGAERSREAVGAGYISKMIVFFENDPTVVPTFVNVGVPVDVHGKVDYKSVQFNRTVIAALATLCGKNFQRLDYMNVKVDLWKAVSSLRLDLSSFGLQVKNACKAHHSNVFLNNDSTVTLHLLREIIEWKLLELSFNPSGYKALAAGNDWIEL
eukprot:2565586-Rhodomonas_salina.1